MAPAALAHLPLEILTQICEELCYHCQKDHAMPLRRRYCRNSTQETWSREKQLPLANLSRCCRRLRDSAQPILHHYLYAYRKDDAFLFARTILSRPDLRPCVQEIDAFRIPWGERASANSPELAEIIQQAADNQLRGNILADFWNEPDWEEGYESNTSTDTWPEIDGVGKIRSDVQCSTLLCLLLYWISSLARVHIRLGQYLSFSPLGQSHSGVLQLRQAVFSHSGHAKEPLSLDQIAPILRLAPRLESLHIDGCTSVSELFCASIGQNTFDEPPPLANVSVLKVSFCDMSCESFRNLLAAVGPKLSELEIEFVQGHFRCIYAPEDDMPNPREIADAISPWQTTLERLSLLGLFAGAGPFFSRANSINSLQSFSKLKTLEMHTSFRGDYCWGDTAVMTNFLPSSIRSLTLLGDGDRWLKGMSELAEAKGRGYFEHLAGVVCTGWPADEPDMEDVAAEKALLRRRFEAVGVNFGVRTPERIAPWMAI